MERAEPKSEGLFISEIYKSIQGESSLAGWPCTFVRLAGCPLRCKWCDTVYSFKQDQKMELPQILEKVQALGVPMVELTGGEPLAQKPSLDLIRLLVQQGYQVLLETSGSEPIADVDPKTHIVMDLKCPGSGMSGRNLYPNLDLLKPTDDLKFVIAHRQDFEWARDMVREHHLDERMNVLFSPAFGLVPPKTLTEWLLETNLRIRLNLQIHKMIWPPRTRGV